MQNSSDVNSKPITSQNNSLRPHSGVYSSNESSLNNSPVRIHSPSKQSNDNSPKKDMFDHSDPLAQIQQIQKTVADLAKVSTVLKTVVDKHIELVGADKAKALEKCKEHTAKVYPKMIKLIEQNSSPNSSPNSSTIISSVSNGIPNGTQCKKSEAKTILELEAARFTTLSKKLIELVATSKHNLDIEGMQSNLKEIKAEVAKAQEDYEDIGRLISRLLARVDPTARRHPEKGSAKTLLHTEFLNYYSKFALLNGQNEMYLLFLEARINLLQIGKDLSGKMKNEEHLLYSVNSSKEQVEVKGIVNFTYKQDKDTVFGTSVETVSANFTNYTREAIAYKENLQGFITKGVKNLDKEYFSDLAFGNKNQLEANSQKCTEANRKADEVQRELVNDIAGIWREITEAQKHLYTDLQEAVSILTRNKNESRYFVKSGTQSSANFENKLLNPDVNATEIEPDWMKESKF